MKLSVGDHVRFLNDSGEGKIIDFHSPEMALVEDHTGFAFIYPIGELVRIADPSEEWKSYQTFIPNIADMTIRNIDSNTHKKLNRDFKQNYKENISKKKKRDILEVDLHAHELLDRHEHLTPGEIIVIQLEHFERMLKNAEEHKISRIIFIHGIGQGVLRAELRKILHDYYPHCEFMDAAYHEYGQGATEVRIHPNRK